MQRLLGLFFVLAVMLGSVTTFAHESKVQISSAWVRPSTGPTGVVFANLHNTHDKSRSLVEVRVCNHVCDHAELHTHIQEGDIMRMRPVGDISLKAGETTRLEPGGLHIMLMGLKRPLAEGDVLPMTFVFDQGDSVKLGVPVQRLASFANKGDNGKYECPCH